MDKNKKETLISILSEQFSKHMHRHPNVEFSFVLAKIEKKGCLDVIEKMSKSGGQPDVVSIFDKCFIVDMYKETPKERSSVCCDEAARLSRKKFPPKTSAWEMALSMGTKLLDETMYKAIQSVEQADLKTSCWLDTPKDIRMLGGALFGDNRYNQTFIYHNGADAYYGVRGFRTYIEL